MGTKGPVPYYKIVRLDTPAVGAEFQFVAPGGEFWRVISLSWVLTTSAVVGARRVVLLADDQSATWFASVASGDVAAGVVARMGAFAGAPGAAAAAASATVCLPHGGLLLSSGSRLLSRTTGIDVGDQFVAVAAQVQSFPQGPTDEWLPTVDSQTYPQE